MLQSLKNYTTEKAVSLLLSLGTSCSTENLVRMTHLMELMAKKDSYKERLRWIRRLIRENHPSIEFPRRILQEPGGKSPSLRDQQAQSVAGQGRLLPSLDSGHQPHHEVQPFLLRLLRRGL
jgi:hypothetical protein